jgi:hypothetical protein
MMPDEATVTDRLSIAAEGTTQLQVMTNTSYNRYPHVFEAVAPLLSEGARVLSFGCSTGAEALSLAHIYLKNSRIVGADVDVDALEIANSRIPAEPVNGNHVSFFLSTDQWLSEQPLFDCILSMSVFCVWPKTKGMENIAGVFPFALFESMLAKLDDALKIGGLLVLYNTNYFFEDTLLADRYEIVQGQAALEFGFVQRFEKDGTPASRKEGGVIFRKAAARAG